MGDYEGFINCLKKPEAEVLKDKLSSFIQKFKSKSKNLTLSQGRKEIASFLHGINKDSDRHLAFISQDDEQNYDSEMVKEGWEKLVMSKLFDLLFGAPNTDEGRSNYVLSKKVETYKWIEERHLELPINFNLSLEIAQAELLRINGFRAPLDKLIILQNVLQLIVDLIKKKGNAENITNDSLLPTLILVILRANPPSLISNIKYIMRYRDAKDMDLGNNQFCMTNYMGAISFIYNMDSKSLSLNDEEEARLGLRTSPRFFKQALTVKDEAGGTGSGSNSPIPKEEFKKFTNQVTGFFGNFIKEVKNTADEFMKDVNQQPSAPTPSRLFMAESAIAPGPPSTTSPTFPSSITQSNQDREKYELELAIAMSLSEIQQKNDAGNPEIFSPTRPTLSIQKDMENEDDEEKLIRKS